MNREDIIRIAGEAGLSLAWISEKGVIQWEQLERFAALVAAAEREACAKVCEHQPHWVSCAAAIRARSSP
jgi:uncharacterized membrane protein (Fun14 family)